MVILNSALRGVEFIFLWPIIHRNNLNNENNKTGNTLYLFYTKCKQNDGSDKN